MTLPKLTIPTYTLTIPSTDKKVKFRPFLSKEEKILMLVKQSSNSEEILSAMKDIVDVCTFKKIDVSTLSLFDIEHIFLQLRAKSVGEIIEIDMKCTNDVDVPNTPIIKNDDDSDVKEEEEVVVEMIKRPCGNTIPFEIKIDDIKLEIPKDHTRVIKLEKDVGVTMRYPSVDDLALLEENKNDDVAIVLGLVENIFDKDQVYDVNDISKEELRDFIENMTSKHLEQIRKDFFYTMPTLSHKVKYKCTKCGFDGEYVFTGINDFF